MIHDNNKGASQDGEPKQAPKQESPLMKEISKQADTVQNSQIAPVTAEMGDPNATLMELVKALMAQSQIAAAREERLAKAEEEEYRRKQNRAEQYARNRTGEDTAVLKRQSNCAHLKGGKFRKRGSEKDFAVYFHRFIDNTQYVKCFLCKMKWYPTDTAEVIIRGGTARANHTGMGWREAVQMLKDSTNQPSSSELAPGFGSNIQKAEDIPDTLGVITR